MRMEDISQSRGVLTFFFRLYGRIFQCPRGKHLRSRRHVRRSGHRHTSRCFFCGKPMVRIAKRKWILGEEI